MVSKFGRGKGEYMLRSTVNVPGAPALAVAFMDTSWIVKATSLTTLSALRLSRNASHWASSDTKPCTVLSVATVLSTVVMARMKNRHIWARLVFGSRSEKKWCDFFFRGLLVSRLQPAIRSVHPDQLYDVDLPVFPYLDRIWCWL